MSTIYFILDVYVLCEGHIQMGVSTKTWTFSELQDQNSIVLRNYRTSKSGVVEALFERHTTDVNTTSHYFDFELSSKGHILLKPKQIPLTFMTFSSRSI